MKNKKKPQTPDNTTPVSANLPLSSAAAPATQHLIFSAQIAATQQISGPIPHPDLLRQYEQLSPGLTARIVKMAEDEALHRRAMEGEAISIQSRDQMAYRRLELVGQIFGLSIGVIAILSSAYMAVHGAQLSASVIGGGGVTALVTAFILGRSMLLKQKDQEFQQQLQAHQLQLEMSQKQK